MSKRFNERSNTPFNLLQFPTDSVLMVVRWRLLYKLSLRDLSDMFLDEVFSYHMKRLEIGKRNLLL